MEKLHLCDAEKVLLAQSAAACKASPKVTDEEIVTLKIDNITRIQNNEFHKLMHLKFQDEA